MSESERKRIGGRGLLRLVGGAETASVPAAEPEEPPRTTLAAAAAGALAAIEPSSAGVQEHVASRVEPGSSGHEEGAEETIDAVLRSAPDGVVVFDASGTILDWSPAAEQILGHRRERAVGANVIDLIFPRRSRAAMQGVLDIRGEGWGAASQRRIEVAVLNADSDEVPVELTLCFARHSEQFAAHLRDARERSDRERQLSADARRRSRLLELGQVALDGGDLELMMRRTLEAMAEEIGLERSAIRELDRESGELVLQASHGWGESEPAERVIPDSSSPLAEALRSASSSVVVGDRIAPDPFRGPQQGDVTQRGIGVVALIRGSGEPLGVISGSCEHELSSTDADVAHLESLAQLLAAAIERHRYMSSLSQAESRLRTLIERLPSITYRAGLGEDGRWYFISPQVEEMLGLSVEQCISNESWWEERVHPDDLDRVLAEEDRCARELVALDIEYRMRRHDGEFIWVRDRASEPRVVEDGEVIVEGLFTDVTAQKEAEERLRHLADHDHLTNLLNRRGFEAAVDQRLAIGSGGAVGIIDLDHLKLINDSLGHAAGDQVLCDIAEALQGSLREHDVLGRLSGDEFGLFVPGVDEAQAQALLARSIELVRNRQSRMDLTASAGIAMIGDGKAVSASDLLVAADLALYQAKEAGRDRVAVFNGDDREQLSWVSQVRQAIEEGELALYAQPIVDAATGEHHSDELLVRMIDGKGEPVPAGQFIPTAERFGLIRGLDRWVASRAVELVAAGRRVSVNISAASIADADLTELVASELAAAGEGVDPSLLTFEITETVATPTIETLREFAERVDRLGCGLSLDDVGTGFGSLTYLQNLRFSQIKVDMQFVRGILDSKTDAGIVRSLVVIAGELGLRTVGEGVESAEVLAKLAELGVDYAQGYHLGKPAPVELPTAHAADVFG